MPHGSGYSRCTRDVAQIEESMLGSVSGWHSLSIERLGKLGGERDLSRQLANFLVCFPIGDVSCQVSTSKAGRVMGIMSEFKLPDDFSIDLWKVRARRK